MTGSIASSPPLNRKSTSEAAPVAAEDVQLESTPVVPAAAPAASTSPVVTKLDLSPVTAPEVEPRRACSMPMPRRTSLDLPPPAVKATMEDFDVGRLLGRGAFGKVHLATHKSSGEMYAIKSLNKGMLVASKQVGGALTEKEVLKQRGHVCIVRLHWAFQDETSLHMVLDLCPGGDLYDRIEAEGTIPLERTRLYAAEITLGLGHLHDVLLVIYRDLKPENILLDAQGHAKLTDFGLAVRAGARKTFCGSTE